MKSNCESLSTGRSPGKGTISQAPHPVSCATNNCRPMTFTLPRSRVRRQMKSPARRCRIAHARATYRTQELEAAVRDRRPAGRVCGFVARSQRPLSPHCSRLRPPVERPQPVSQRPAAGLVSTAERRQSTPSARTFTALSRRQRNARMGSAGAACRGHFRRATTAYSRTPSQVLALLRSSLLSS